MTARPDFEELSERLAALAAELAVASEHGRDEIECHLLRLKALTMEHYATELRLLGERLHDGSS